MVIPNKKALLLSKFIIGGWDEIEFQYDENTSVLESCSLVIENRMFILGGVYDEGRVLRNAYFDSERSSEAENWPLICDRSSVWAPIVRNESAF